MTRAEVLREAADYAEFYGNERMLLAGDAILHDPLLRGEPFTQANLERSQDCTIDGCINSSAYHAAMHIAEHLRDLANKPSTGSEAR